MTYKELIETLEIVAKYDGGLDKECDVMWAEHDEHGIVFDRRWDVSAEDIRKLAAMGWGLGCDDDYDEDDDSFDKWENYDEISDKELVEIFKEYNGIYKFE